MSGIWVRYNAALAAKPLQTKTMTSFTGFVLGDLVAQSPDLSQGKPWDAKRTAKMGAFGLALHGPIGHYWYGFLDKTVMASAPTSATAVFTKTAIDQVLWAPIFTSVFFGSMKVMDGKPGEIADDVKEKLWPTMKVNCAYTTLSRRNILPSPIVQSSSISTVVQLLSGAFRLSRHR